MKSANTKVDGKKLLEEVKASAKAKEEKAKFSWAAFWHGIMGIGLLLAVMSIVFSSYRILTGTDDLLSWVLVAPQVVLASVILFKRFTK